MLGAISKNNLQLDTTLFRSYSDDPSYKLSLGLRYPLALASDTHIACMFCTDTGCEKKLAIYESLRCQGPACKACPGGGAVTVLCERCALDIDLRKMLAQRTSGADVKRNFVCQCPKDSEVQVTSYAVTTGGLNNQQRCFLLSRGNQTSLVMEGDKFFNEKPSLQMLVEDPSVFKYHVQKCFKNTDGNLHPALTFNASSMSYSSDAQKVRIVVCLFLWWVSVCLFLWWVSVC